MDDVNIRFASTFRCPTPCKTEVDVERSCVAICPACGKKFERSEITELLLSQGRFFLVAESDTRQGERGSFGRPEGARTLPAVDVDSIGSMIIDNGTVSADVEYTNHEDGTWSFKLMFEDDPVPIESTSSFPTKELAEEQVKYELQAASLRIAEG